MADDRNNNSMPSAVNGAEVRQREAVNVLLDAALEYASWGLPVFPCRDKRPLTATGFHDATTDPVQIRYWWSQWPWANIGMPTEGWLVVDIDIPDGCGRSWPQDDAKRHELESSAMAIVSTPRGGRHLWFVAPEHETFRSRAGWPAADIDLRTDGGYVILPPSVIGEDPYEWVVPMEADTQPAEPPGWYLDAIRGELIEGVSEPWHDDGIDDEVDTRMARAAAMRPGDRVMARDRLPEGVRHQGLLRLAAGVRRYGFNGHEIAQLLHAANAQRCDPPLPDNEVVSIAEWAGRQETDAQWEAILWMRWEAMGRPLADLGSVPRVSVREEPSRDAEVDTVASAVAVRGDGDPGPVPREWLSVPGFVDDVAALSLATAPYPNRALAFASALCLQAHLSARRVRTASDTRPNLYMLALADSGTGKEWGRKVNVEILTAIGGAPALGDSMVSAAGIEDALATQPAMLFQTDEIDSLLLSINKARDERWTLVMQTLLKLYSQASSVYTMRKRSGGMERPAIQQPHLTLLGTAIPELYYQQLSERMLTNGFFARTLVVEADPRPGGREGRAIEVPQHVEAQARWWLEYSPGTGNLEQWHPKPHTVPTTPEAARVLSDLRENADRRWADANRSGSQAGKTLWARLVEHANKLALLWACSENPRQPVIETPAAEWAAVLSEHVVMRMLWQVEQHSAENDDERAMKRILSLLRDAGGVLRKRDLLRRLKCRSRQLAEWTQTLCERHEVEEVEIEDGDRGPAAKGFRLTH